MYTYMSREMEETKKLEVPFIILKLNVWYRYDGAGCACIGNITTLAENACLNLNVY